MKHGTVTKLDKRKKTMPKQIEHVIVIFPIYGQFETIRKLDSGCLVCKP